MISYPTRTKKERLALLEQLRVETRWNKTELIQKIRIWKESYPIRFQRSGMTLKKHLDQIIDRGADLDLFDYLLRQVQIRVCVENTDDDDDDSVVLTTLQRIAAEYDQSILDARWETPEDLHVAYAMCANYDGLVRDLETNGYVVNDAMYSLRS